MMYGSLVLILWGISVPSFGCRGVSTPSAKSRAQIAGYSTALSAFKNEYGEFPKMFQETGSVNLAEGLNAERFFIVLSGRYPDGSRNIEAARQQGNRKCIAFYSFGTREWQTPEGWSRPTLVDGYGNRNIVVVVDIDGDGKISVPVDGEMTEIDAPIGIYTLTDNPDEFVATYL